MRRVLFVFVLLFVAVALTACGGGGDQGETQDAQVSAGGEVWNAECASCHEGGSGPELNEGVVSSYGTAQALYDYIHTNMPLNNPGSLSEDQYWDVTAWILDDTGMLPADTILGPDTAGNVNLGS